MKISRLVLLAVIAGGAAFLASDRPFDAGTWPLPGSQLSVRVPLGLRHAGDYFIEVAMPKASTDKRRLRRRKRTRRDPCDFGGCTPADRAVSIFHLSNLSRSGRRIRRSWRTGSDRTTLHA